MYKMNKKDWEVRTFEMKKVTYLLCEIKTVGLEDKLLFSSNVMQPVEQYHNFFIDKEIINIILT